MEIQNNPNCIEPKSANIKIKTYTQNIDKVDILGLEFCIILFSLLLFLCIFKFSKMIIY